MPYIIWGTYQDNEPEEIDEADDLDEALDLSYEYRMAFDALHQPWTIRVKDERGCVIN